MALGTRAAGRAAPEVAKVPGGSMTQAFLLTLVLFCLLRGVAGCTNLIQNGDFSDLDKPNESAEVQSGWTDVRDAGRLNTGTGWFYVSMNLYLIRATGVQPSEATRKCAPKDTAAWNNHDDYIEGNAFLYQDVSGLIAGI